MSEESIELLHVIQGFGSLHKKGDRLLLRLEDGNYINLQRLHGPGISTEDGVHFMRQISTQRDLGLMEGVELLEQSLRARTDEELSLAEQRVKRLEMDLASARDELHNKTQVAATLKRLLKDATKPPAGLRPCARGGSKVGCPCRGLAHPAHRSPCGAEDRSGGPPDRHGAPARV